ncbi:AMP-binding protein [Rivibacter subsaxonicus]|uniref:AMP-binding enzyme n=1 Tax=Rivibacter subsaxonicus TaxID=457575 RepID=A0A4Q7W268_9BURK|nr:AMP-binding protein [Rivibacter subsaxonicus]RZU03005.1 AMP-binding enzyme [Rivibacter subsaxonicus]
MAELIALGELALPAAADAARVLALRDAQALTRADWLAAVDRWQTLLIATPGPVIALHHDDPFEFSAALWGAWHAGKRVCIPADRQPATLERLRPQVDALAGELPGGLLPAADSVMPIERRALDPQRASLLLFTSGSSGEPAAIPKSLAQLQAEIEVQHALHGIGWAADAELQVHATVSHHHIYGLLFALLWPLAAGRVFATRRIVYPEEMVARLAAAPSLLVASPAHLKRLPEQLDWAALRGHVRAVLSSGGPLLPESAQQALTAFGVAPIEIYGSSETGGIAWRQRALHGDAWQLLPGVDWRVEAELLELSSPFLPDRDWYRTSDRVQPQEGGHAFTLLGRVDRIVKIEEKRVSLTAIEQALRSNPLLADARALVLAGAGGERIAVVSVPSEAGWELIETQGERVLHERLREGLAAQVERVALPRRWREVLALPFNAQGKLPEATLRGLFEHEGEAAPARHWLRRDETHAEARLWLASFDAAFDGHFPGAPILAGVLQLDWAIAAAREAFGSRGAVLRMEALKFQQPVRPATRLTLALEWRAESSTLVFAWSSRVGSHSGGRLVFGECVDA